MKPAHHVRKSLAAMVLGLVSHTALSAGVDPALPAKLAEKELAKIK